MAEDESVIREVEQELAEERQWAFFRKYGSALIGGAVAIVAGVAGWQIWTGQQTARSSAAAVEYNEALQSLVQNPEEGRAALASFAEEAPAGYAALAQFRRAGSLAAGGDREGARAAYRTLYQNSAASAHLRDLARLRAGYLSIADGRQETAVDLGGLIDQGSIFGAYAREIAAVAALEAGDYSDARAMFARAVEDVTTPLAVRQRAEEFAALASAGEAGVNIKGEARVEDLLNALDAAAPASPEEPVQDDLADTAPPSANAPVTEDGSEPDGEDQ